MYNTSNNTLSYIPISFFRCELFFMTLSDSMKSDMLGIWIEWRRGCREEFQNAQSILSHTWIFFILLRIFKEHISCYFSVDFRYSFERWEIKYRYYYIDKGNTWIVIWRVFINRCYPISDNIDLCFHLGFYGCLSYLAFICVTVK